MCSLYFSAFEFGVLDAMSGVRQMLVLVWSREQTVYIFATMYYVEYIALEFIFMFLQSFTKKMKQK